FSGLGLPLQAGWVAQAAGVDAMGARCPVDFPDSSSFVLRQNSVFGDVAVRPDADVKLGAIRTGQQTFGPVMIDRSAGKVGQLGTRGGDARLPFLVGIADDGVGVCDVKVVTNERDAKGRVEVVQEDRS